MSTSPRTSSTRFEAVHPFDAVVLAGGPARRMAGTDKAAILLAGRTLLDRVLDACSDAQRTIVVGPRRPTDVKVFWTREDPPGGGPVAGLVAGMDLVESAAVTVLAADLPFLEAAHVRALLEAAAGHDGAVSTDSGGRDQTLAAAYRTDSLRRRIEALDDVRGASMRELIESLDLARVQNIAAARDCDTWDDVARARSILEGGDDDAGGMGR